MEIAETLQKKIKFGNALLDKNPVMLSGSEKLVAKSFVFMKCSGVLYILHWSMGLCLFCSINIRIFCNITIFYRLIFEKNFFCNSILWNNIFKGQ